MVPVPMPVSPFGRKSPACNSDPLDKDWVTTLVVVIVVTMEPPSAAMMVLELFALSSVDLFAESPVLLVSRLAVWVDVFVDRVSVSLLFDLVFVDVDDETWELLLARTDFPCRLSFLDRERLLLLLE